VLCGYLAAKLAEAAKAVGPMAERLAPALPDMRPIFSAWGPIRAFATHGVEPLELLGLPLLPNFHRG
jgi:hypothetical protein